MVTGSFGLAYAARNVLQLGEGGEAFFTRDPFQHCPIGSTWGNRVLECLNLQACDVTNVTQVDLPQRLLFDRRCHTIAVFSPRRGKWRYQHSEQTGSGGSVVTSSDTTTMAWSAYLYRTGKRQRGARRCTVSVH